ncbi:MAG: S41 family peptidase [Acidobacteriota bacterium]
MIARIKLIVVSLSALIVAYSFLGGVVQTSAVGSDAYRELTIFVDILHKVRQEYVEEPNMKAAMKGALQGMIESLDAYSSYVDSQTYRDLSQPDGDAFPGLVLSKRFGYIYVVSVLPGSPASGQGLRSGDLIESIAGEATASMSLWEAQHRMLGEEGSSVEVRVVRARRSGPTRVVLKRAEVALPDATSRMVEDGIGVLDIPHFGEGMARSIRTRLEMLKSSGVRGLIVDVRGTAQGDFSEAALAAGYFLPQGSPVMTMRDRSGGAEEFLSQESPLISEIPVQLLVDRGTSGAAEVFVAALQDHQAAGTLGERTNGQGSVQESFRLQDGSMLILSTKLAFRPSGDPIQAERARNSGVVPDLRWPGQDFETGFYYDNIPEGSNQELGDDFYRRLAEAIEAEQLRKAVEKIRETFLNKKAA